ncbi:MAG: hypothetical protein O2970_00120 [Proteobacteria bacterium]|nr:hypothetical protein [Pseudomonadota bacterium]MDA0965346.1 hypothetical protein [Pseudomonadota bacterium]
MFRSKTVFILGAGASEEVGLPIGETLKNKISQKIDIRFGGTGYQQDSGDYQITQALRQYVKLPDGRNGDINPYLHAAWKLRDALTQGISIDNVLDAYRDDKLSEMCGKLGIVRSILEAERSSKIFYNTSERQKIDFDQLKNTWFAGFVKILTENISQNEIDGIFDNVSILSFNYDRCIEHYLYESLQNYYSLEPNVASQLMQNLKIFHPYGSVGKLPWQESNTKQQVPFGAERSDILNLSEQIKTFNERTHEIENISEIQSVVQEAEIIVFLGFAFHRQNLELIKPDNKCNAKKIFATAYGISKSDCEVIHNELYEALQLKETRIEFRNDLKCGALFNEYWRSLTA